MTLDHVSFLLNPCRWSEATTDRLFSEPASLEQFLLRVSGIPVAPGFFLLGGLSTTLKLESKGWKAAPDLVKRACVLVAVDAAMSIPDIAMNAFGIEVLTVAALVVLATAASWRWMSERALLVLWAACLVVPWLVASRAPHNIVTEVLFLSRGHGPRVPYPLIPWVAMGLFGSWLARRRYVNGSVLVGAGLLAGAVVCRAMEIGGPPSASFRFWAFDRYPLTAPFALWAMGLVMVGLSVLRSETRWVSVLLQPVEWVGRAPLVFYAGHFATVYAASFLLPKSCSPPYLLALAVVVFIPWALICRSVVHWKSRKPTGARRLV